MAEQESRLAIRLDSSGAEKQADSLALALVKMTRAGEEAERAADDLEGSTKNLNSRLRDGAAATGRATKFTEEQREAFRKLRDQIDPVGAAIDRIGKKYSELKGYFDRGQIDLEEYRTLAKSLDAATNELTGVAKAERDAAKAADEQKAALQRLAAQLDPISDGFRKIATNQKLLDNAKSKGMLSTEQYDSLSGKLKQMRGELELTQAQLGKTGMSARQTAFAMRMIPAQMTDIVVGLSTGQSPFMVLMQQGGQLKDMFGGIGPAIKGVGGYVAGLINPFTLAVAAVGALGAALYSAEKQASALNKSTNVLTNVSGLNLTQTTALARGVSGLGVTYSDSVDAVGLLTQAISQNTAMYPKIIQSSSEYAKASGQDISDVLAMYQKLSTGGIQSIDDLDDKLGFLTVAQRKQADEAAASGNIAEAQRIAFAALSGQMDELTKKLHQGANGWDNFWASVGRGASGSWDTVKEIVGGDYFDNADVRWYQRRTQERTQRQNAGTWTQRDEDSYQSRLKVSQAIKDYTQAITEMDKASEQQANKSYLKQLQVQADAGADAVTRAKKALQAFDNEYRSKDAGTQWEGGAAYATRRAQLAKNLKDAEDAAAKKNKPKKEKAYTEDATTRLLAQLNQQYATLQSQYYTTEKIGTAQQSLIKWERQLADIKIKKTLTADQKSLLANQRTITDQYEKNAALEKEIALRKDADKLTAYKNTLSSGLQNDATGLQNSLNSNTVLSQEQKRLQELAKIASDYQKKQVELTNQRTTGQISQNLYDQETAALQQALDQRRAMQHAYYTQIDQLNSNWQLGVQNGMQSYLNSVPTLYESVTAATTSIFSSTESAISSNLSAMLQGTESLSNGFKNMAAGMGQAVIDALTKMAAQWLVYQAVQLLVGKTAAVSAAASMVAQATAMSQMAGINAYASAAAIPVTGWAMAPAAMAAALAATTPLIASVTASSAAMAAGGGLTGMAHNGIDSVPSTGTWLLEKGERVMTADTSARLDSTLENLRKNGLDATLSKPGFGTGVQNVNSDNSRKATIHAPIEQHFHSPAGVTPDQMAISMAQTQKRATTDALNQVAAQVLKGDGKVGNAMRSKYPGRGMS